MQIEFFNEKIDIRFVSHKTMLKHKDEIFGKEHDALDGYYYERSDGKKIIRVDKDLTREKKLEIFIHELTHAARFSLSEEFVRKFGEELTRLILEFWEEL